MRIKATTDYAIRAVLYLAVKGEQCSSREISEAMHIPRDLLVQIAIRLRQASILAAQSGKYGGYSLMKKPADITLYDVVSAMEDEPALPGQDSFCEVTDKGAAELVVGTYQMLQTGLEKSLTSTTIEQIAEKKAIPQPEFATA